MWQDRVSGWQTQDPEPVADGDRLLDSVGCHTTAWASGLHSLIPLKFKEWVPPLRSRQEKGNCLPRLSYDGHSRQPSPSGAAGPSLACPSNPSLPQMAP